MRVTDKYLVPEGATAIRAGLAGQPIGRAPPVFCIDSTALRMCWRSSASLSS
jgi:hypothetical protein